MSYRLTNQKDPRRTLRLNTQTWYNVLDLAVDHGWNPLGTVGAVLEQGLGSWPVNFGPSDQEEAYDSDGYTGSSLRLVFLEDALNLADALDRAFMAYEPEFVRYDIADLWPGWLNIYRPARPGLGVITEVAGFCQRGAFYIDRF